MTKASVLVIGSGGREHAIARSISLSPRVGLVFCAPGNAGIAKVATLVNLDVKNHADVIRFVEEKKIELTVIGPEAPLVAGLADDLRLRGHRVVGAGKQAAQLEGSKVFAKNFMMKYGIPTAAYKEFTSASEARAFINSPIGAPFRVLKADGLAAGKGVFVTESKEDLLKAVALVMDEKKFGAAGEKIVLEETLSGPEVSLMALTDGTTILPLSASQDHKRVFDGDKGPNTGGMGAYAPTPFYTEAVRTVVEREILDNFIRGIKAEKFVYRGIIYFGLMLTDKGPQVLEFNVRLGDPETQVVLPLVESDLFEAFLAVAQEELKNVRLEIKTGAACTVVMASGGYPGTFETGVPISGLEGVEQEAQVLVFHAGTRKAAGDQIVTAGGRVLSVTGLGATLDLAVQQAYHGVNKIKFKNAHVRSDIAAKALANKRMNKHHDAKQALV